MRRRILLYQNNGRFEPDPITGRGILKGYEAVDLELPSKTIWATFNVGASNEYETGGGYCYGATSTTGAPYMGTENPLPSSRDTAAVIMGGGWHMPTSAQCRELSVETANTTYTWETDFNGSGVSGGKFTSKKADSKYCFFTRGYHWTSTPYTNDQTFYKYAFAMFIEQHPSYFINALTAYQGSDNPKLKVRAVFDVPYFPVSRVLFANSVTGTLKVFDVFDWPAAGQGWTPIGIEVVPREHNRYGDGTAGYMSLVTMDMNYPETGEPVSGENQIESSAFSWGGSISAQNYGIFKSVSASSQSTMPVTRVPYQGYELKPIIYIGSENNTIWPYVSSASSLVSGASIAESNDGGYVYATSGFAICDFNGIRNTAALYILTKGDAGWAGTTVTTSSRSRHAICAGRFKTVGTNSFYEVYSGITENNLSYGTSASTMPNTGFWYLPGIGEMSYLPTKAYEINKTISALNRLYGSVGLKIYNGNNGIYGNTFISSTERDGLFKWVMNNQGVIRTDSVGSLTYFARAFLRF